MFRTILAGTIVIAALATASTAAADYAAIAYSKSTKSYGYSYDYGSREAAEAAALNRCDGYDKKIVVWVHNGWCALALGDGTAYGYGWSTDCRQCAKNRALEECSQRTSNAHITVSVFSGN